MSRGSRDPKTNYNCEIITGKRVELRCIAKNSDSKGVFEWKIDDVLQQSDRPLRDMGNGVFEQSLEINTVIDLDQKEVECR